MNERKRNVGNSSGSSTSLICYTVLLVWALLYGKSCSCSLSIPVAYYFDLSEPCGIPQERCQTLATRTDELLRVSVLKTFSFRVFRADESINLD